MTSITAISQPLPRRRINLKRVQRAAKASTLHARPAQSHSNPPGQDKPSLQTPETGTHHLRKNGTSQRDYVRSPDYMTSAFATQVIGQIMSTMDHAPLHNAAQVGTAYQNAAHHCRHKSPLVFKKSA